MWIVTSRAEVFSLDELPQAAMVWEIFDELSQAESAAQQLREAERKLKTLIERARIRKRTLSERKRA